MPVNILQGNTAEFVVEFLSSDTGELVSPTSASVTVYYYVNGSATSTSITLTENNSFWTGSWSTSGADLGTVTWTTASSATTNPAASGTIRIIDP